MIRKVISKSVYVLAGMGIFRKVDDEKYLRWIYRLKTGKNLNLIEPKTFNDKINWLKLYDRKQIYKLMVDKYEAKKYVSEKIGKQHVIPTLGVWSKFDEIDFSSLPQKFVLKCTNDSGSIRIIDNKNEMNVWRLRRHFERCKKRELFDLGRDWAYKDVKPRIIAEDYMVDESGTELKDYKVYVFNGVPKIIQIDYERFTEHKRVFYSADWKRLDLEIIYQSADVEFDRPVKLSQLLEYSAILASGTKFLRTDFYIINDEIYFGEMTFYPEAGFGKISDKSWELTLGEWIDIRGDH